MWLSQWWWDNEKRRLSTLGATIPPMIHSVQNPFSVCCPTSYAPGFRNVSVILHFWTWLLSDKVSISSKICVNDWKAWKLWFQKLRKPTLNHIRCAFKNTKNWKKYYNPNVTDFHIWIYMHGFRLAGKWEKCSCRLDLGPINKNLTTDALNIKLNCFLCLSNKTFKCYIIERLNFYLIILSDSGFIIAVSQIACFGIYRFQNFKDKTTNFGSHDFFYKLERS